MSEARDNTFRAEALRRLAVMAEAGTYGAAEAPSVEAVTDDDRRWFAGHPTETLRLRPMVQAEYPDWVIEDFIAGCGHAPNYILVTQLEPGIRIRGLMWILPETLPYIAGFIPGPDGVIVGIIPNRSEGMRLIIEHILTCPACQAQRCCVPVSDEDLENMERPADYLGGGPGNGGP